MGTQYPYYVQTFLLKDFKTTAEFTGQDIRIARKCLGLTQEALADRLQIAVRAIEKWEHFLHCPTPSLHKELFQMFKEAQAILEKRLIPPDKLENILWIPPGCKPYNLVCKFKNGTFA